MYSVVDPVGYSDYDADRPRTLPVGKMPDCGLDLDFLRLAGLVVAVAAVEQQAEVCPHLDDGVLAVDYLDMMQAAVSHLPTSTQMLPARYDICRLWLMKADYPVEQRQNDVLLRKTEDGRQELLRIPEQGLPFFVQLDVLLLLAEEVERTPACVAHADLVDLVDLAAYPERELGRAYQTVQLLAQVQAQT